MRRFFACLLALLLMVPAAASAGPKGYIALTFDDGPTGKVTEKLLDGLAQRGVKATFFLCGYRMEQFPDTLCRIAAEGHEIGLHSYGHTDMKTLSKSDLLEDLRQCTDLLTEAAGIAPTLIRPPGGLYTAETIEVLTQEGYPVILWSVDPEDWNSHNAAAITRCLIRRTGPGDILLMHDLYQSSVQAALRTIDLLQQQGYQFCTISELAEISGTTLKPGQVYRRFVFPTEHPT